MGKLGKFVFADHCNFDCERRIFFDIGEKDGRWIKGDADVGKDVWAKMMRRQSDLVLELGKKYEQQVYTQIQLLYPTRRTVSESNEITITHLNPEVLQEIFDQMISKPKSELVLLEHSYPLSETFARYALGLNRNETIPIHNVGEELHEKNEKNRPRPDVLILGNQFDTDFYTENGDYPQELQILTDRSGSFSCQIRNLLPTDCEHRIGISILDIKHTNIENVGKKHFAELLFYAWTLAAYLHDIGFQDKFYVRVQSHGIFPAYKETELPLIQNIRGKLIDLKWQESAFLIENVIRILQRLYLRVKKEGPLPIESIEPHISVMCGRFCSYLGDCKKSMKCENNLLSADSDLRLLPYTNASIAEQLRTYHQQNVGDLAKNLTSLPIPHVPNPLYAEIPLLETRVKAALSHKAEYPPANSLYSNILPQFTQLAITFDLESDPINERIHSFAVHLDVSTPAKNIVYYDTMGLWWKQWASYLVLKQQNQDITAQLPILKIKLDTILNKAKHAPNLPEWMILDDNRMIDEDQIEQFAKSLDYLTARDKRFESAILTYNDYISGGQIKPFLFAYGYINGDINDSDEFELAKELVLLLHHILVICNMIEYFVLWDSSPSALFYWGYNQMEDFQMLLERHLRTLMIDPDVMQPFNNVIHWIAPSQSNVQNPIQHKKFYDLQSYVETVVGYPSIIDVTWHQIAEQEIKTPSYEFHRNPAYWPDHFNFMVFNHWHEMVITKNTRDRDLIRAEILKQILHKTNSINRLRAIFQKKGREFEIIPKFSKAVQSHQFSQPIFSKSYHVFATVWYLFSKLNGTMDEMEKERIRLMYPQWSIGKLESGEAMNLKQHVDPLDPAMFIYTFELCDMSIYMKLDEGSRVLLISDQDRANTIRSYDCQIIIAEMKWLEDHFLVSTESTKLIFQSQQEGERWFLYPNASDPWTRKLYVPKEERGEKTPLGLLDRCKFGQSWLGHYLAYRWKLNLTGKYPRPKEPFECGIPELYLYAPSLLPREEAQVDFKRELLTKLRIKQNPVDPSQKEAILIALNETIAAIQGPPGTGKTQTVAALIDEFILRFRKQHPNEPVHILISALSYSALDQVLEKLVVSVDDHNVPVPAVLLPRVYCHSEDVEDRKNTENLSYSGNTWKLNGKSIPGHKRITLEDEYPEGFIFFANSHALFNLGTSRKIISNAFHFDLIIVDEASQLPIDYFMAPLQFVNMTVEKVPLTFIPPITIPSPGKLTISSDLPSKMLTKIVIVGDNYQLPPVQAIKPPLNLRPVLSSLFSYYVQKGENGEIQGHGITKKQLGINYRSNEVIVGYTNLLNCYDDEIGTCIGNKTIILDGPPASSLDKWLQKILDPKLVVCTVIHANQFETSVSPFEAEITASIVAGYYNTIKSNIVDEEKERAFWNHVVGVVAPHNAQCHLIRRKILERIVPCFLSIVDLQSLVSKCVASVDKFQGSERHLIISSIGISAKEQLRSEEEFIYDLNRFNVLTSRAKKKIVLITSRNFLEYIPNDRDVMGYSAKIRQFALEYCENAQKLSIPFNTEKIEVDFRYRK